MDFGSLRPSEASPPLFVRTHQRGAQIFSSRLKLCLKLDSTCISNTLGPRSTREPRGLGLGLPVKGLRGEGPKVVQPAEGQTKPLLQLLLQLNSEARAEKTEKGWRKNGKRRQSRYTCVKVIKRLSLKTGNCREVGDHPPGYSHSPLIPELEALGLLPLFFKTQAQNATDNYLKTAKNTGNQSPLVNSPPCPIFVPATVELPFLSADRCAQFPVESRPALELPDWAGSGRGWVVGC